MDSLFSSLPGYPSRQLACYMSKIAACLATLLAATLAGCVAYQGKDLTASATQAQLDSRRLDDAGLRQFLVARGGAETGPWDLPRLTLAAFYFQPELEVARAELAVAEAEKQAAGARPNPAFAFTPGQSEATPGGISPWILGYALSIPVELAGRRDHRVALAGQKVEVARLALAARAWAVHSAVRRALIDLDAAEAAGRLWREQLPLLARAAQLVEAQARAGDIGPLMAAQTRTELNRATLAAREAERGVINARSRLAEAIGVSLAAVTDLPISAQGLADRVELPAVAEARTWAAQNRPDLLAALAEYAAAQAALQGEVARQYPDLQLGPGYQLDQGEGKWSLGLSVSLPIFHHQQGPIAAAEARRTAAAARFLALQNRVMAEVDRAAADYSSVLAEGDSVGALRKNLARQTEILRAQFAAGEISRLDLTRMEIALAEQTRLELDARARIARTRGALEDAVRRPLSWPEAAWREARPVISNPEPSDRGVKAPRLQAR